MSPACRHARKPFGLVALEAAQFGVPTVLSTHAGVSEILRSNPVVCVGDVSGFAAQVMDLLEDESLRHRVGEQLIAEAECVTWERAAHHVLAAYRDMPAESPEGSKAHSR